MTFGVQHIAWLAAAGAAALIGVAVGVARRRLAWVLRMFVVALVLTAISVPHMSRLADPGSVVVLVDRSASMPPGWSADVLRGLPAKLAPARVRFVSFAGSADRFVSPTGADLSLANPVDGSDPSAAVQLALGDSSSPPVLLFLTDGNWTLPAASERSSSQGSGLAISALETAANRAGEGPRVASVWALCSPAARANAGVANLASAASAASQPDGPTQIAVRATLSATRRGVVTAVLSVFNGERFEPSRPRQMDLWPGQTPVDWRVSVADPTTAQVRVELAADWDELPQDNVLTALADLPAGDRRGVILADRELSPLAEAIAKRRGAIRWQVVSPGRATVRDVLGSINPPAIVVIDDQPRSALEPVAGLLRDYVQSGGGLLVLAGKRMAGDRWHDSPLDALLPVRTVPREHPPTAFVLLLDRSGSMSEPPTDASSQPEALSSASKLDVLKQAVLSLPDAFGPADRLAVIGFSDDAKVLYATDAKPVDWQAVRRALLDMSPGGGTGVSPALRAAADWLARQRTPQKHVLLLSDGKFSDATLEQAADMLRAATQPDARLTVSTFAASDQAERAFLADLAQRFNGRFYPPGRWSQLHSRFSEDLASATVPPQVSGPIEVTARSGGPAMPAIAWLLTSELRPDARMWYSGRWGDCDWPVVAVRAIGAGRSGAVLGATGTEGSPFALVAAIAGAGDDPRMSLRVVPNVAPDRIGLDVWARDGDRPVNLLDLSAMLVDASGVSTVAVPQVAPGRYFAAAPATVQRVVLVERIGEETQPALSRAISPPLPVEFAHLEPKPGALDDLCRRLGGRLLTSIDQAAQIVPPPAPRITLLAPWLLLAAMLLWAMQVRRGQHRERH